MTSEVEVPVVAPIKALDLTWYNKLPEADL